MPEPVFGIDFGTTNSVAALVVGAEVRALTEDNKPHPSVVWYRGGEVVVGREARRHLESLSGGIAHGFVRSPKMALRNDTPIHVEGRDIEPAEVVAQVLRHIRSRAANRHDYDITRAVMTIPVDFGGPQRRLLRAAARKAGISVHQFVHEPAAALYAHLRAKPDFRRELAQLENRFDERLSSMIRDRHAEQHGIADITALEQPGSAAALLVQCEQAKIALSSQSRFTVIVKDYLRGEREVRDLAVDVTREDLVALSSDLVNQGLAEIDRLLEDARLDRRDIERCIATGGVVNMPAIWDGLVERFGGRVPVSPNRDTIIAEGAAWIAHDGLRPTLSKPIEVLVADGAGRGTYLAMVEAGLYLPVENEVIAADNRRFFSIDPRDGTASFEFAKPRKVGLLQPRDERAPLCLLNLPIDPDARPFLERLECQVQIDHDYVAHVTLSSKMRGEVVKQEFHDLEFGLALPGAETSPPAAGASDASVSRKGDAKKETAMAESRTASPRSRLSLRSNVAATEDWTLVPGDIVENWKPGFLVTDSRDATDLQRDEKMYYALCAFCRRTIYEIRREGPIETCKRNRCSEATGLPGHRPSADPQRPAAR